MTGPDKVRKRSANVCVRCRRQKIKCSGTQPCSSCSKRDLSCMFNNMDQKVLVTRRYIADLQQKAALMDKDRRQKSPSSHRKELELSTSGDVLGGEIALTQDSDDSQETGNAETGLFNPLATGPPTFMSPGNGRIYYLGTSSNWSFTRRVLSLAHQHVYKEELPTKSLIFEGGVYDLGWDGSRADPISDNPVVPSLDHAIYLVNTVKFRCGQIYHLFDDIEFMKNLHEFYNGDGQAKTKSLWYIQFLLILAFGKCFTQTKFQRKKPPGMNYFIKAIQVLPDHNLLYSLPMISTEILCCIALFYQALDCRSPAHNYIGQAMRMALSHGMHTGMPVNDLGQQVVERCQRIWWTVYILDRHMTSIQGLPQSIDDRFVQTGLPSFSGIVEKTNTLSAHIKLCRNIADINSTVYAIDGRINQKFLLSTKVALSNIAELSDTLRESFPIHLDEGEDGISRIFAYLHLFYQECVIVATRPLLFCFLKIRLESPETCVKLLQKSESIRSLMGMCLESAQHSIRLLDKLKSQGLLETFLTFDLEFTFISTVVLLIGPVIYPTLVHDHRSWIDKAYNIFREMVEAANQIAKYRWSELQQLDETLHLLSYDQPEESISNTHTIGKAIPQLFSPATSYVPSSGSQSYPQDPPSIAETGLDHESSIIPILSSAEIMALADSIGKYDAEWISGAMMDHDIW